MFADVVVPRTPLNELTYWFDAKEIGDINPGDLVAVPLRKKTVIGVVFRVKTDWDFSSKKVQSVISLVAKRILPEELLNLVRWVANYYVSHLGEVMELVIPRSVTRRTLERYAAGIEPLMGLNRATERNRFRVLVSANPENFKKLLIPFITQRFNYGSVIVLMPDSAWGEFLPLLRSSFGEAVMEYHHRLSKKQQRDAWYSIIRSSKLIVAGIRSAIWLPVKKLAGVVVINENASSFKEERIPCYHARDVAIVRARLTSSPVLLYASPLSMETWWNVRTRQFRLIDRVNFGCDRSRVFIVDMRFHRNVIISPRLMRDLKTVIQQKQVAVCYINRKGFSHYVVCEDCGTVLKCPHCHIPAVLAAEGKIRCRLCGFETGAPERCAQCQGANFGYRAIGVDMVLRELKRMGIDAENITSSQGKRTVPRGGGDDSGYAPVLVGTRGLLHQSQSSNLALVALINYDAEFRIPDFRTRERAFEMLVSVLRQRPNRLVIQTHWPNDPVLGFALKGDVAGFLNWELKMRTESGFPPYTRLVSLTCFGKEPELQSGLRTIGQLLEKVAGVELLGPIRLFQKQSRNAKYRWILKLSRNIPPWRIITKELVKLLPGKVKVDVDPLEIV